MTATSGSFNAAALADRVKDVGAWYGHIPAATGAPAVLDPVPGTNSFTVLNVSHEWLRGTVTYTAGTSSVGAAAEQVFLVPPVGNFSGTFLSNSSLPLNVDAVDSMTFDVVPAPSAGVGTVEASTVAALTTFALDANFAVNFLAN
jgi:hypothetical protein